MTGTPWQVEASPAGGKIWLDLHLKDPGDSTTAVLAWPNQSEVTADPVNAKALAAVLDTVAASQTSAANSSTNPTPPQVGQGGEDFVENLKLALAAKGFSFADGFDLSDQATSPKLRFGINYTAFSSNTPPPTLPTRFELWVRTSLLPADSPAYVWSVRDLAIIPAVQAMIRTQQGQSIAAATGALPENFRIVILPAGGPWLRSVSASNPDAVQFTPIFAVAVAAANEALRQQLLEKPRTIQNRDALATALRASFNSWRMTGEIAFNDELSSVDNAYDEPDQPAWVLRLTDFDPVRQQAVAVDEVQLGTQGRQPWAAFVAHQQIAGKTIAALLAQKSALEEKLGTWLNQRYPWGSAHFATDAEVSTRISALRQQPGVAAVESKIFRDQVAYSVVWYPTLTTLEASGTYNSDRGGNLSTKLGVQTRDYALGLEGYIANRRRGLFADASTTPKISGLSDNAMVTWGLLADYSREDPVRFGTPKKFSLEDEETKAGVRWRLEGGHTNEVATTYQTRRWKLEAIGGYRHARLNSDNFAFTEKSNGAAPFASTELVGEWEHGARKSSAQPQVPDGALHLEVNFDASPRQGTTADFARGQFKAVEEIHFGHGRLENSLLRLTASGGSATDNTPVAWWFRLGGDERMRGFEFGELTGRSFAHAAIEGGITAGALMNTPEKAAKAATPSLPFDLHQIRLLLGIEHAWIGESPTFSPPGPTVRGGWSYSLTGEYAGNIPGLPGNSKLALGYGYAPNSSHRSGRVFVSLRVPLSIPQPQ